MGSDVREGSCEIRTDTFHSIHQHRCATMGERCVERRSSLNTGEHPSEDLG